MIVTVCIYEVSTQHLLPVLVCHLPALASMSPSTSLERQDKRIRTRSAVNFFILVIIMAAYMLYAVLQK